MKNGCDMEPVTAYLALGANLGERQGQLQGARGALAASGGVRERPADSSSRTRPAEHTSPVENTAQPLHDFNPIRAGALRIFGRFGFGVLRPRFKPGQ